MPATVETQAGQTVSPSNLVQQWLLENWQLNLKDFHDYRQGREFILVLVGDLIEGIHHRTREVWSPEEMDHCTAAIDLLQPLSQSASMVLACKGTECHTKNYEEHIAQELNVEVCPKTKKRCLDTVNLEVGRHLVQFRHHMPTTSRVYLEAGALSIVLGNTQLSYSRAKQRVPDIVVSGHRHREGVYYDSQSMMICCPAWQALTRHGHKVVPGALPRPSLLVIDFVRGQDLLPYPFFIQQAMPKQMESVNTWQGKPTSHRAKKSFLKACEQRPSKKSKVAKRPPNGKQN